MILPLLLLSATFGTSTAYYGLSFEDPAVHHILERIVIEEAKKINRTADEHAAYCLVRLPWQLRFTVNDEDELSLRMELSTLRYRNERQLNSSDEMLLHFQKKSPVGLSIYKKLNAFVDGKMKEYRFGQEAIAFIKSLERTQLFFAAWGYNELAGRYVAGTEREGKVLIRKAVSAYLALSETAKNDLEKMWCIRTFYQTLTFLEATGNIRIMREILRD